MIAYLFLADILDPQAIVPLGAGAILLVLVFRTLWRQDGAWAANVSVWQTTAERALADAAEARERADEAEVKAQRAVESAAIARIEAHQAKSAEGECRRRLALMEARLAAVEGRSEQGSA